MIELSRRLFVGGGLVLVGASAVSLRAPLRVRGAASVQQPVAARRFVDLVGIAVHASWRNTAWGATDWEGAFLETGVKNVRSRVGRGRGGQETLADLRRLFAHRVKLCAGVAHPSLELDETRANIEFLARHVGAENISAIEGPNEFNKPSSAPPGWAAELRSFVRWMHDTVRSYPALANVPIVAPSIWGRLTSDYITLGNLEPYVDRGNLHYYTGGRRPTKAGRPTTSDEGGGRGDYGLAEAIREAKILAPTKPLWITEFGYQIAGPGRGLRPGVISETAAAKYVVRGLLDAFELGVEKVFIYLLVDDVHRSPPRYHGLIDGSMRKRLAFHSVQNLMALFADEARNLTPRTLAYRLSGDTGSIKRQLFQKSDGSFLLTMYQDVDSYDRMLRRDTAVAPVPVGLQLARPASTIQVFTPSAGPTASQTAARVRDLTIPVRDDVTVVKIVP